MVLVVGGILALTAGALCALSMVLQRYALTYPEYIVPVLCYKARRPTVWLQGFASYMTANVLFALSALMGPLSLLATLFTLLLVWNLVFARFLLKEYLTPAKISGALLIVLGAGVSVGGTPMDAPTEFNVTQVTELVSETEGTIFLLLLLLLSLAAAAAVKLFERAYELDEKEEEERAFRRQSLAAHIVLAGKESFIFLATPAEMRMKAAMAQTTHQLRGVAAFQGALRNSDKRCADVTQSALASGSAAAYLGEAATPAEAAPIKPPLAEESLAAQLPPLAEDSLAAPTPPPSPPAPRGRRKPRPPAWLNSVMALVYPASLGLLEGVTQLTMKGIMGMGSLCFQAEPRPWPGPCYELPTLWLFVVLFSLVGVMTVIWLKIVYTRYETTEALPIEYGTVHACSVLAGYVFYKERDYMDGRQKIFSFIGLALVIGGVALSSRKSLPCERARGSKVQPQV